MSSSSAKNSIKNHSGWPPFAVISCTMFAVLAIIMPLLSLQFGITWDDWHQLHYGRLVIRWFISGGADTEALTWSNLQYYGGTFDTLTALIYGLASGNFHDFLYMSRGNDMTLHGLFELRHVMNSLVGVMIVVYTGLLSRRLGSWRTCFISIVLLVLSPRFFGHSMNNPKDIPFAFGYLMAVYHLIALIASYPKPKWRDIVLTGAGIAIAVGVRIAGLFLLSYAWVFILLKWLGFYFGGREHKVSVKPVLIWLGLISLIGYVGGILAWPFALVHPIKNPMTVLVTLPHLISGEEMSLFEGKFMTLAEIPWYYIPKWIAISSPIAFLIGLPLAAFVLFVQRKKFAWDSLIILIVSAALPLILVFIQRPHFYNGWRHLLFIYPQLIILAAIGWDGLYDLLKRTVFKVIATVALVILLSEPLAWMVRNHPNEYVYFNPLVGGIDGARGKYELDYWGNCMRDAAEWVGEYHQTLPGKKPAVVQNHGSIMSSSYYLNKMLKDQYIPFSSSYILKLGLPPNYYLVLANQLKTKDFDSFQWPPDSVLYQVKADNTTLCAVLKKMR